MTLDGVPVRCGALPVLPRIVVTDRDGGFLVRLEEDPEVREVFTNGAVLHGEELRPAAEPPLTGRELHDLPRGLRFAAGVIAQLVTDILPSLAGRLPVDIKTRRLPGTVVVPPRIVVDVWADAGALVVLAVLAYGEPIQARIDGGRLVHIAGAVPVRDATAEERLVRRLADDLGLAPGEARRFEGAAAAAFAARLEPWGAAVRGDRPDRFAMWPRVEPRFEPRGDDFALAFECVEEARAGPWKAMSFR